MLLTSLSSRAIISRGEADIAAMVAALSDWGVSVHTSSLTGFVVCSNAVMFCLVLLPRLMVTTVMKTAHVPIGTVSSIDMIMKNSEKLRWKWY